MFEKIEIHDFKNYVGEHSIILRQITVLVGPNGAGKSSIGQTLLVFKQSAGRQNLVASGSCVELGKDEDIVNINGKPPRIGFTLTHSLPDSVNWEPFKAGTVSMSIMAGFGGQPKVSFLYTMEPFEFVSGVDVHGVTFVRPATAKIGEFELRFQIGPNVTIPLTIGSRDSRFPEAALNRFQAVFGLAEAALHDLRSISATRGFFNARFSLGDQMTDDFAQSSDTHSNGAALVTTLTYGEPLMLQVREAIKYLTGVTFDTQLTPGRLTAPVSRRSKGATFKNVVMVNEGFGTNQLVHLVSQVLSTPAGGTVLIEEPEIHLHPLVQTKLALWLARHAKATNKQLLVSTHSEYFLAALLSLVRDEQLSTQDMVIHYCSLDADGNAHHQRKDFTQGGILQGGFREFFPDPSEVPNWREFFRGLQN